MSSRIFVVFWVLLGTFLSMSSVTRPARAASAEEARELLASQKVADVAQGVSLLFESGDIRALSILTALDQERLGVDEAGTLLLTNGANGTVDALSGAARPSVGAVRMVIVNNQVRRALEPTLAGLRLLAPERAVRLNAAEQLVLRPIDAAEPILRRALQQEKDNAVRGLVEVALARIDLSTNERERRINALRTLRRHAPVQLKGDLERLVGVGESQPAESDPELRALARQALDAIQFRLGLASFVGSVVHGVSLASVLLIAALGLAITFGLMRVINMAHGEMLMIGAYATYVVQGAIVRYIPSLAEWYLLLALPVAFMTSALVGAVVERLVVCRLYGRPLETLLATWGVSLVLMQAVRSLFGAQNVAVANPRWLSGGVDLMPGLVVPYSRIAVVSFVLAVVVAVWLLLRKTSLGLQLRAVTENREMAAGIGVATSRIDTLTFALGSGVAGLGGVALSQLGNVGPELGQQFVIDSFMVVVLGGVGKIAGTVVAALGLGILNKILEPSIGAVLGKIVLLGVIILFVQRRPQGLFSVQGRTVEG